MHVCHTQKVFILQCVEHCSLKAKLEIRDVCFFFPHHCLQVFSELRPYCATALSGDTDKEANGSNLSCCKHSEKESHHPPTGDEVYVHCLEKNLGLPVKTLLCSED